MDRIEARSLGWMDIQMVKGRKHMRKVGSEGTNSAMRATGKGGKGRESQRTTVQARVRDKDRRKKGMNGCWSGGRKSKGGIEKVQQRM